MQKSHITWMGQNRTLAFHFKTSTECLDLLSRATIWADVEVVGSILVEEWQIEIASIDKIKN